MKQKISFECIVNQNYPVFTPEPLIGFGLPEHYGNASAEKWPAIATLALNSVECFLFSSSQADSIGVSPIACGAMPMPKHVKFFRDLIVLPSTVKVTASQIFM